MEAVSSVRGVNIAELAPVDGWRVFAPGPDLHFRATVINDQRGRTAIDEMEAVMRRYEAEVSESG